MTYLRTWALMTALIVLSNGSACQAQKVTVDPNASDDYAAFYDQLVEEE